MSKKWEEYEKVATYLLNQMAKEFGLDYVEGKQILTGKTTGTGWKIDAKGVRTEDEAIIVIECRRYTSSRQTQAQVAALAYTIKDTGANGGIMVSPLGLQKGASKIANAENIQTVRLTPDSTTKQYVMQFLNRIFAGFSDGINLEDSFSADVVRTCDGCGTRFKVMKNEHLCANCS